MSPLLEEKIRTEIIEAGIDDRFAPGAYEFVLGGLAFQQIAPFLSRDVQAQSAGQELSIALLMLAHHQYGLMARRVLENWGIRSTEDLGCIAHNMVCIGLIPRPSDVSTDDFYNVMNIESFYNVMHNDCFKLPLRNIDDEIFRDDDDKK